MAYLHHTRCATYDSPISLEQHKHGDLNLPPRARPPENGQHSTLDYLSPTAYEAKINQQPGLRQVA
jgi:hypothetical protein